MDLNSIKLRIALCSATLLHCGFLLAQEATLQGRSESTQATTSTPDSTGSAAWKQHGFSESQRETLRDAFRWGIENHFIPGAALLIIHRGEVIFREGAGVADLESKRPFSPDAPCRIASVTKSHTATLIAMLVDRGELAWDDPVDKYLPNFKDLSVRNAGKADRSPTIRELLSHTAGFAGNNERRAGEAEYRTDGTLADAVDDLARTGLVTQPGTVFAYTGLGYMVAGRIAEVVTKQEFGALMKQRLFVPVGAETAAFQSEATEELASRMPTMYERSDRKLVKADLASRGESKVLFPTPGGGLVSTLDDVGRMLMLHRNRGVASGKQIVSASALQELYRPQKATGRNRYALGFNVVRQDASGLGDRIRHTGASGTFALIDFKQDLIVVMLSQVPTKQTQPFGERLMKAIDSIFPPQLNRIAPKTSRDLQSRFQPNGKPLSFVSAHRGGAQRGYPENCIATFEKTLQSTSAIMEVDPRYTKDGIVVLHHDATLDRTTTGTGRVADYTLAELKSLRLKDNAGEVTKYQIPTLDEAIEWARGKTILVLDQKDMSALERVQKITERSAESFVLLIVNSFNDAQACYAKNPNVMMEVMIPTQKKAEEFNTLGIPWRNIVAFVGHAPPEDRGLYEYIHSKGTSCMIGTSRNLDRDWITGKVSEIQNLESEYRAFLNRGADIIETDIPTQIGPMLFRQSIE